VTLALVVGTLASAIVLSHREARSHIQSTFALRSASSAVFVSAFITQQADRERHTASRLLAGRHVSARQFGLVVAAFGSDSAVLLDSSGRLLQAMPRERSLIGAPIANRYADLAAAERGQVAVSGVVSSEARRSPAAAIAVPFQTRYGRRVLSIAYASTGSALASLVNHTIPYPEHEVMVIDGAGRLVAASPATEAPTVAADEPALARALAHSSKGSLRIMGVPSTFTTAPVPHTNWRFVVAVPDSRLYASISGLTQLTPWIVFALVTLFAVMLVVLFARSLADRARLTVLSQAMAKSARTDSLTGLNNRRALTEQLTRTMAHARRHDTPVSVLMLDLDNFKQVNDRFGHAAGDQVLCTLADCMRDVLRADDIYGRLGGDEFLVIMPNSDTDDACAVAERLSGAARAAELPDVGLPDGIELSIGVATGVQTTPEQIVHEADVALYDAKSSRPSATSKLADWEATG
jgi:diguanylate cyclase (GGDEF)-like protein